MDLNRKSPRIIKSLGFFQIISRQRPTFPQPRGCSIIGPGGLNFRVRNGNGWTPSGMVTENYLNKILNIWNDKVLNFIRFHYLGLIYLDHIYQEQMLLSLTAD